MIRTSLALLLTAAAAWGYVPRDLSGLNLHRADYARIQFLVNQNVAAGLTNADGRVWITPDSDPLAAINAALRAWSAVQTSAARFSAAQSTTAGLDSNDRQNVILFYDTPDLRSVLGSAVAATAVIYTPSDGTLVDTDIVFNPAYTFSTTLAEGTFDLQSFVTHELGHALGANHTNVLGASMFQAAPANDRRQSTLSSDDVAFVSALYPAAGGNGYGTITGKATFSDGSPVRGGLVTLVDPSAGVTVSGMSSLTDGAYRFQAPAGQYYVYLEPLGGYMQPGNLYVASGATFDTNFATTFLGGAEAPSLVTLPADGSLPIDLQTTAGAASFRSPYIGIGRAGGFESATLFRGPVTVTSGQAVDLLIAGEGIEPLTEQNLQILGPRVSIRPGTLRKTTLTVSGYAVYRVTLDVAATTTQPLATIAIKKGSTVATLTGVLALGAPQVVNAGSFLGGAVSPGEVVSFFGVRVGPSTPVFGAFESTGALASSLGGVTITFDGVPAPLFYAGSNQVNVEAPYEITGKSSTRVVATYNGKTTGDFTIPVAPTHPGICVVTNADGSANGPQSPASVGGVIVVWGTGAGVASALAKTGAPSPANATVPATVTIGDLSVTPAYAGLTPGGVGLMQVNVVIPPRATTGNAVPLKIRMGNSETQTVPIAIR